MSGRTIKAGLTDQYCEVKVWTTADGVPNTTLVFNTAALAIWYQIGNAAAVEVVVGGSPAPATMAAGGAHADWGIYHVAQGRYKIGLADDVVSAAANVTVWIVFTDCDSAPCEIDVVGYDKTAVAVGANTVVPDAAGTIPTGMALETTSQTILTDTGTTIPALIPTISEIADQVWDEATAGHTSAGTYGGRVVRSTSSNVEVQITGSNHIAADVHEFQVGVITAGDFATDAITAAALAADAVTEIQSGLATQVSVDVIDGIVDTILIDTNDLQLNQGGWLTATGFSTHSAADVWSVTTRALTATGLAAISTWTVDVTGSLSGNVGGIAGTITTLDALDTAQDTQHGTTQDRLGYTIAALAGASSDAGTAAETYAITLGADTYTIDHSGLDSTGNRGTATLTKT